MPSKGGIAGVAEAPWAGSPRHDAWSCCRPVWQRGTVWQRRRRCGKGGSPASRRGRRRGRRAWAARIALSRLLTGAWGPNPVSTLPRVCTPHTRAILPATVIIPRLSSALVTIPWHRCRERPGHVRVATRAPVPSAERGPAYSPFEIVTRKGTTITTYQEFIATYEIYDILCTRFRSVRPCGNALHRARPGHRRSMK